MAPTRPARAPAAWAVAGCVVATLAVVLLVTWAAGTGPGTVLEGAGPDRLELPTASPSESAPSPGEALPTLHRDTDEEPPWIFYVFGIALQVAVLGLLVAGAVLVVRSVLGARRRERNDLGPAIEFDVLDAAAVVARQVAADREAQQLALLTGSPRNGVVACWNRFEVAAAEAGLARHAWETSSEYTLRVLDLVTTDDVAVARLAALFREARFSEHELSEADRQAAVEALAAVHRGLRRTVPA